MERKKFKVGDIVTISGWYSPDEGAACEIIEVGGVLEDYWIRRLDDRAFSSYPTRSDKLEACYSSHLLKLNTFLDAARKACSE